MMVKLLEELRDAKDITDINIAAGELWLEATNRRIVHGITLALLALLIVSAFLAGLFGMDGPVTVAGREVGQLL